MAPIGNNVKRRIKPIIEYNSIHRIFTGLSIKDLFIKISKNVDIIDTIRYIERRIYVVIYTSCKVENR